MGNCLPRSNHSSVTEISVQKSDELETKNGGIILTSDAEMKKFSLNELKKATKNFGQDMVLGMGGFGKVYKGWIDGKTFAPSKIGVGLAVAVKQSYSHGSQGFKEWQSEVDFLGKLSHPNLVKLVGCCSEDDEYILVYEYLQKGSLDSHLFRKGAESSLSWGRRLKIAVGAARGLTFLHNTEKQVIYRDFKSSNILLDRDYNAKLSDFGLAKLAPTNGESHLTTLAMGTLGYVAPEYLASGHLYVKSDVYGFGVVLLELLTGLRVLDTSRPIGQTDLVGWARPSLSDRSKLEKIMDPRLGDDYPLEGAFQVAAVVLGCLEADPKKRPSTEQVLETLNRVSDIKMTAKGLRSIGGTRRAAIGQR